MNGYIDIELDDKRKEVKQKREPLTHQREAFNNLDVTFTMPITGYKGSLLVLPTGAGKTFTATNWISRNVLSRNIKVLWLAQSSYLLDQATKSFIDESGSIPPTRKFLKIRTVSSSKSHANSGTIALSDDVIIVTSQTAIKDVLSLNLGGGFNGENLKFKLQQWVDSCADSELFVVLDEAHHAPAYGCRSLLLKLKEDIPNLYILGLTATPAHMDDRISGWLKVLFDKGVCNKDLKIEELYTLSVLVPPKYIEKSTGREMEVDDKLYERIVNEHKDLPENIIDTLARDSARNNYIIGEYINNRVEYGKTIIFADRWFQCEYIAQKLNEKNIATGCMYSMISHNNQQIGDMIGRRDNKENEEALRNFRKKDNEEGKLDVLVNVKMLNEGVDVPDVRTVMITRNTTSSILFTQMMGRALRGKAMGAPSDKVHANIVLFSDNWKRLLPFINVTNLGGGTDRQPHVRKGTFPLEWISIMLVRRACRDIEFSGKENYPTNYFIPIGWYETEYTVAVVYDSSENDEPKEELLTESQSVMVFNSNENTINNLIDALKNKIPDEWASESVDPQAIISDIISNYAAIINFEDDVINVDGNLKNSVVSIVRHMAQNGNVPQFIPFEIREQYNIDVLVKQYKNLGMEQVRLNLKREFQDDAKLWSKLYKKFDWFWQAYSDAFIRETETDEQERMPKDEDPDIIEFPYENFREIVLKRDNYACRCCGKILKKGVSLQVDHILPIKMGGKTVLDNLQTLCKACNNQKGVKLISFLNNISPLNKPVEIQWFQPVSNDFLEDSLKRIINFFYRADVVCNILYSKRSNGKYYRIWKIIIYPGNNLEWILPYKQDLLNYIKNDLGWPHVDDIEITNEVERK